MWWWWWSCCCLLPAVCCLLARLGARCAPAQLQKKTTCTRELAKFSPRDCTRRCVVLACVCVSVFEQQCGIVDLGPVEPAAARNKISISRVDDGGGWWFVWTTMTTPPLLLPCAADWPSTNVKRAVGKCKCICAFGPECGGV